MPIPWSITAISTTSASPRAVMVTRGAGLPSSASGEYATAFSARLATAVISWLSLPYTVSPRIPTKPTSSPLTVAGVRVRSITSATIRSTETGAGSGSGSPPCSRVRSSSSLTSRPSRVDSCRIRSANRRAAARSWRKSVWRSSSSVESAATSVASSSASASNCRAPTGVFSSWLTLATKSRRTRATRCASVTSAASTVTYPSPSATARMCTPSGSRPPPRGRSSSTSRRVPVRRACPARVRTTVCATGAPPTVVPARSSPISLAAGLASTARSSPSRTSTPTRSASRLRRPSPLAPARLSGSAASASLRRRIRNSTGRW